MLLFLGAQLDGGDLLTSKIKGVGGAVGAVPEELTTLAAPLSPSSSGTWFCSSFTDSDLGFAVALSCGDTSQDRGKTRRILTADNF